MSYARIDSSAVVVKLGITLYHRELLRGIELLQEQLQALLHWQGCVEPWTIECC